MNLYNNIFLPLIRQFFHIPNTEGRTKWPSIWSIDTFFISIIVLEINIQKQRPLHGDYSFVNEVFNMNTITFGKFFNTNCVVDYLTAHILSYLVADSQFHYCSPIFRRNRSLRNPQRKYSHVFKSGLFGGHFCPHAKRSGNRFGMTQVESVMQKV
jgi:hypothetical protein